MALTNSLKNDQGNKTSFFLKPWTNVKSSFLIGRLVVVVVADQNGNLQLIHDLGWSGGMNPSRYQMCRQLQTPQRRANKAQSSATTHPFPLVIYSKHRKTACLFLTLTHSWHHILYWHVDRGLVDNLFIIHIRYSIQLC